MLPSRGSVLLRIGFRTFFSTGRENVWLFPPSSTDASLLLQRRVFPAPDYQASAAGHNPAAMRPKRNDFGRLLAGRQAAQHPVGQVRGAGDVLPVLPVRDPGSRPRRAGQAVSVEGGGRGADVPILSAGARQPVGQPAADRRHVHSQPQAGRHGTRYRSLDYRSAPDPGDSFFSKILAIRQRNDRYSNNQLYSSKKNLIAAKTKKKIQKKKDTQ